MKHNTENFNFNIKIKCFYNYDGSLRSFHFMTIIWKKITLKKFKKVNKCYFLHIYNDTHSLMKLYVSNLKGLNLRLKNFVHKFHGD